MVLQSWSKANSNNSWGQNIQQSWVTSILAFGMISGLPPVVMWFSITLAHFDSDFSQTWATWHLERAKAFINHYLPRPSSKALNLYLAWVLFQAILYTFLPGYGTGQLTPAGNLLSYNINGLLAWQLTIALAICAMITGYIHPTIIAENWEGLLISANIYEYLLSAVTGFEELDEVFRP
ncbi:uncharacterized protein BP5553_00890 [Venustampulla echinocandica]|uniref:7-dehydrocholesterol reductase n=1 Tax=Venustampulla echinocandica TaxID=2656787 RepID=A0A370TZF3_9HELO|nr:uncharacterized protein BP5553_00890 [Venustampulla echinocandica]RDL40911.1 hypothetical protein BP5553_00890 [Venustampulla echinocandica]